MKLIAWDPAKRKHVLCGTWVRDRHLIARVVKPEHFMRVSQSYGIQEVAFEQICKAVPKIKQIVFQVEATGDFLFSKIDDWLEHGKVADYGHGKQRFLGIKFMERKHKKA